MPDRKPITPGARFGHWTVIDVGLVPAGKHHRHALCECICGCRKLVESGNLISGASGSCGCLTNAKKLVRPSDRFGRLVIVKEIAPRIGRNSRPQRRFTCLCDCGNSTEVRLRSLMQGHTKSCGCLQREIVINRSTKHGGSGTALYLVWNNMWRRCTDPGNSRYSQYGGRGIKVCSRWGSFENFRADMGERPSGHSLDRINNDGDYEPGNCRWATVTQQAFNKQCTRHVTIGGVTRPMTQWIALRRVSKTVVYRRIRRGLTAEQAIEMG